MPAYSLGTMGAWAATTHTDQIITGLKTFENAGGIVTSHGLRSTFLQADQNAPSTGYPDGITHQTSSTGWLNATATVLTVRNGTNRTFQLLTEKYSNGMHFRSDGNGADGSELGPWRTFATLQGSQTFTSEKTFQTSSGVPVTVQGVTENAGNLFEWKDETGLRRGWIYRNGTLVVENGSFLQASQGTGVTRVSTSGSAYGIIQMFNNTTPGVASTLQGRVLYYGINSAGTSYAGSDIRGYSQDITAGAEWSNLRIYTTSGSTSLSEQLRIGDSSASLLTFSRATTQRGLIVRGAAGQSVNLTEWQDSAGAVLARLGADGGMRYGDIVGMGGATYQASSGTAIYSQVSAADRRGLIIRGAPSQSANLTEWQASTGAVYASVDGSGGFNVKNVVRISNSTPGTHPDLGAYVQVVSEIAGAKGMVVRAAPTQSASLSEWQNSAGNVLASITPSGQFRSAGLSGATSSDTDAGIIIGNRGGSPTANPTGGGMIYVINNQLRYRRTDGSDYYITG